MSEPLYRDYENWTRDQWIASDFHGMCERLVSAMHELEIDAPAGTLVDVAIIAALHTERARAEAAEKRLAAIAEKAADALYADELREDYQLDLSVALEQIEAIAKGETP